MIILSGSGDGVQKRIIGLSRDECTQILAGKPFTIADGLNVPPGAEVVIVVGETTDEVMVTLARAGMVEG